MKKLAKKNQEVQQQEGKQANIVEEKEELWIQESQVEWAYEKCCRGASKGLHKGQVEGP